MQKRLESLVRKLFRLCGLKVSRAPRFKSYEYLKKTNIKTILDIGANSGQFAMYMHKLIPEAKIYSFEPLKECYDKLLSNMQDADYFKAFHFALGDENKQDQIFHNNFSPSSSILPMTELHKQAFPFTKSSVSETVVIKKLDDMASQLTLNENILIKMDVQGYEDKIIIGGKNTIAKAAVLIVETSFYPLYKGQAVFDGIYSMLKEMGFVFVGAEEPMRDPENGTILQCDSVFCHKSYLTNMYK